MKTKNLLAWKKVPINLFSLSTEKIFEVLHTIRFDIISCFGRGKGYDRYYIEGSNGDPISIYDLPDFIIENLYEDYKGRYFKERTLNGGVYEKTI